MNYKSYMDLSLTINRNLHKIPRDIDLVVGVPRSGMLPATMIGLIFNKPVVALDSYLDGKIYEMGLYRRPKASITNYSEIKKVLIMDDSINSGHSINTVKEKIIKSDRHLIHTIYGAVYYAREGLHHIDFGLEECAWPRIFQWNILNSWVLADACLDIDGVVCTDPTEEQNDDSDQYKDFLKNAKPLFLTEFPIGCFVTSRLEKYRALTEEWLRANHLNYAELIMLDLPTKEERLRQNKHALFKADVYKNRKEGLFIESNLSQAIQISQLTGKLVFCTENMKMIQAEMNKSDSQRNIKKCLSEQNIDIPRSPQSRIHIPERSSAQADDRSLPDRSEPHVKLHVQRILFVNHNIAPYELSGTPLSTLNHALGMTKRGLEVAVLIPSVDIKHGFRKDREYGFTLYRVPAINKYKAFFAGPEEDMLPIYSDAIDSIIDDFSPHVVHINDYVFMPARIIEFFSRRGCFVVRNVCNCEEICHRDYPVISAGFEGRLCTGPDSLEKCAACFITHMNAQSASDRDNLCDHMEARTKQRFNEIRNIYNHSVDKIVFTTEAFRKYFTNFMPIPDEKMAVIPRGFRFDFEIPGKSPRAADGLIHFAFIGNIMFSKGIDIVLKAFEALCERYDFVLHIHGAIINHESFPEVKRLEEIHPGKFIYHGPFGTDDLPQITRGIDVCLIPSYFDTYNRGAPGSPASGHTGYCHRFLRGLHRGRRQERVQNTGRGRWRPGRKDDGDHQQAPNDRDPLSRGFTDVDSRT